MDKNVVKRFFFISLNIINEKRRNLGKWKLLMTKVFFFNSERPVKDVKSQLI